MPFGRYVMYLRKSRADMERERLGEFETLSRHQRDLEELSKRLGIPVDMPPYRELASGESVASRPVFLDMMREVQSGGVTGVVVHAVDRLGRGDMMEFGWILSTFQFTGTLIVTPGKVYDPADKIDLQQLQMQMFFANTELSGTKERLRSGKERAAKDGQHIASRAPVGYRKVVLPDRRKSLEPSEWAPNVERAFESVANGDALSSVSRRLSSEGVPGSWNNRRLKTMIENPVYKGCIAFNRTTRKAVGRDGMEIVKRTVRRDDPIVANGLHPAIVSEELWERANAAIRPSTRQKDGTDLRNPLAGLLRCATCGRALTVTGATRNGRTYRYVRHYGYCDSSACECAPAPLDSVVEMVADALSAIAEDIVLRSENRDKEEQSRLASIAAVRSQIERIAKRTDRLVSLYMDGGMDAGEYRRRRSAVDEEARAANDELDRLVSAEPVDADELSASLKSAALALKDSSIGAEDRNRAARAIIDSVLYRNASNERGRPRIEMEVRLIGDRAIHCPRRSRP